VVRNRRHITAMVFFFFVFAIPLLGKPARKSLAAKAQAGGGENANHDSGSIPQDCWNESDRWVGWEQADVRIRLLYANRSARPRFAGSERKMRDSHRWRD